MATTADLSSGIAQTAADFQTLLGSVGTITEAQLDPVLQAITDLDAAIKAAVPAPPQ